MGSTATTCEMCQRPVGDNAVVCRLCADRTARHLRSVIELAGEIETTVARLGRYSDRHGRPAPVETDAEPDRRRHRLVVTAHGWPGSVGEEPRRGLVVSPLPYDESKQGRWNEAAGVIVQWARFAASERGGGPLAPSPMIGPLCRAGLSCPHSSCQVIRHRAVTNPVARAAEWLSGCLEWIRHRPDAVKALNALETAAETIVRLVDSPPPLEYAGPCYTDLPDGGECQEHLYAIKGAPSVRCPACGTRSSMDGRRDWLLREANAVLAHATDIARALTSLGQAVSASKIRNLAARKRITARGADGKGNPLYLVGEVRAVLADIEYRAVSRAA